MKPLLLILVLSSGCIHMHRPSNGLYMVAPPSPRCNTLASRVMGLNLGSVVAGGLGGASATGAALFDTDTRYYLAGTAALFALTGAITSYLATYNAAQFSKEKCE